jgi:hypothetical protein
MILNIISAITTFLSSIWSNYRETKQAQHETNIALEKSKLELIEKQLHKEHELNIVRLKSTSSIFKYFTFIMWFGPFVISWVFPGYGAAIFENLKLLPEWYIQSCMAIMFTIWSINVSKETIGTVFQNITKYMTARRKDKLKRKMLFDIIRSHNGPLNQHEVKAIDKAFDYLDGHKGT